MGENAPPTTESFGAVNIGLILDETSSNGDVEMTSTTDEPSSRLVVAVDFGTTFSSVAYALVSNPVDMSIVDPMLGDIKCITNYPDDRPTSTSDWRPRQDVPTELWYSIAPKLKPAPRGPPADLLTSDQGDGESADSESETDSSDSSSDDEMNIYRAQKKHLQEQARLSRADILFWGFEVQKQFGLIDIHKDNARRISRFKLMLDESADETKDLRGEIAGTISNLKRAKLVKKPTDVISDYLRKLFTHVQDELSQSGKLTSDILIELVLCVPAVWPAKACRIMQSCMEAAARMTGFGNLEDNSISNLFIVSEPEAAAACVLAEDNNNVYPGETIVILDAGGGTVDAVTYKIQNSLPLRMSAEVVKPGTKLCGASFINERLQKLLLKKLKNEDYLVKNGKTIQSIVEDQDIKFENAEKRLIDVTRDRKLLPVVIDDLRPNPSKGLHQNKILLTEEEVYHLYKKSLKGATKVLKEQLRLAKDAGESVQKVLLIGGFGESPSLKSYLKASLAREQNFHGHQITLITSRNTSTVVARGAVLRACNKSMGPERITSCSYGFLSTESYDPKNVPAHENIRCIIDPTDGEKYVQATIYWHISKGDKLAPRKEYCSRVTHTFPYGRTRFICVEELWVSDHKHESHYRKTHANNKGAELAGTIVADMSFLYHRGLIAPFPPSLSSKKQYRSQKDCHWQVDFDLVMIVDGRNLYYEARWPPSEVIDGETVTPQVQTVQARGQTCIAAAFLPGTL